MSGDTLLALGSCIVAAIAFGGVFVAVGAPLRASIVFASLLGVGLFPVVRYEGNGRTAT